MHLSVVMPTYNRVDRVREALAGLEAQTFPCEDFEVLMVSDGSSDGTEDYLRSLVTRLCVRPLFQPNLGPAAARNLGVAHAAGRLLLFLDDDVVPSPDLIAEHVRAHASSGGPTAVFGPMLTPADFSLSPWVAWEQFLLSRQYRRLQNGEWRPGPRNFYTGNASVARQTVLDAGGFDPAFRRAEDVELAYRLEARGVTFEFEPRAVGYHYAERSYASWIQTAAAYGRNDVIFTYAKGQDWLLPTLLSEFRLRHPFIRLVVRACLNRPARTRRATQALRHLGAAAYAARLRLPAFMAFSGLYNLSYYQGMADELCERGMDFWSEAA